MRDGWVETTLGQYIHINTGKLDVNAASEFGEYPFFTCSRETYRINEAAFEGESVLVAGNGDLNVKYYDGEFNAYQRTYVLNSVDKKILDSRFLFLYMQTYIEYLRSETRGTVIQYLKKGQFTDAKIKLPPLPEQKRIVDLISSVDSCIEAHQQQLESAKRSRNAVLHELLTAGGDDWLETTLGEVSEVIGGGTPSTSVPEYWEGEIVWLTPTEITSQDGEFVSNSNRKISELGLKNSGAQMLPKGSVILTSRASVGFVAISAIELCTNQGFQSLVPNDSVLAEFLMFWIQQNRSEFESRSAGSTFKEISKSNVKSIKLSLPPLSEQRRVVEVISTIDEVKGKTEIAINEAKRLRSGLLSDLLSGEHEIPASYDKVIGAA
jgi:type I restriction enzyme S subunit